MKNLWILTILIVALTGCKAKERIVYQHHTDSIYVSRTDTFVREVKVFATDTVRLHDSIIIERINTVTLNEAGDTIYRDRVIYRDRWHDATSNSAVETSDKTQGKTQEAFAQIRTDTVYVKQNTGATTKKASVWERIGKGAVVIFAILLLLAFLRYKKYT